MRSSSIRYLNTESYIGLAMLTIIGLVFCCFLQTLCRRVEREFTLNLPSAAKCYANIHIFSIRPKASGVIILCPTGKTCAIRHVVVVIRSLNILIMNKELNLLIHAKTTKHSLSFASHSAYCRHVEILLRVIKESTTSVLSLV